MPYQDRSVPSSNLDEARSHRHEHSRPSTSTSTQQQSFHQPISEPAQNTQQHHQSPTDASLSHSHSFLRPISAQVIPQTSLPQRQNIPHTSFTPHAPFPPLLKPAPVLRKRLRQSSTSTAQLDDPHPATKRSTATATATSSSASSNKAEDTSRNNVNTNTNTNTNTDANANVNAAKLLQVLMRDKKQRACSNCRKAKLKCIVAPGESDCIRCQSRQERCAFTARTEDDWQQTLGPATYAATQHLAQLSAAVHHILDHLVERNLVPPFATKEYPDGLDTYEPPDRESFGAQSSDREQGAQDDAPLRKGKQKPVNSEAEAEADEGDDEALEQVSEHQEQATLTTPPFQPSSATSTTDDSSISVPRRFWNSTIAPNALNATPVAPPPHAQPPPSPLYTTSMYQPYPHTGPAYTYQQTFGTFGSIAPVLEHSWAQQPHPLAPQQPPLTLSRPWRVPAPASRAMTMMSTTSTPTVFSMTNQNITTSSELVLSSPLSHDPPLSSHSTIFVPDNQPISFLGSSGRAPTISPIDHGSTPTFGHQGLVNSILLPLPIIGPLSETIGSRDPRKDIVKKNIISGSDATTLVTYFHVHLSQFMYGYPLQFNQFPYIGGPETITPLILAVLCLIASERFPLLQQCHSPLAEEVLNLLKKSPAESWQAFEAPYGTNSTDFDGDEPLDAEFGLGPEEIVAACVLATYMTERQEAALIARSAFRWARGWIKFLSSTPTGDTRGMTFAEITGCVPPERQATTADMARVWLLCYVVDSTERLQLCFPAPPDRDPTPHCELLAPSPTSYSHSHQMSNVDDILLTYHARLMTILNDWRRQLEAMIATSRSPHAHAQPLIRLGARVNDQLDKWQEHFATTGTGTSNLNFAHSTSTSGDLVLGATSSSVSSKARLVEITWLFVKMSVNGTVSKCLSSINASVSGQYDLNTSRAAIDERERDRLRETSSTIVVDSAIKLLRTCANWRPEEGLTNLSPTYLFFVTLAGSELLTTMKERAIASATATATPTMRNVPSASQLDEVIPLLKRVGDMLFLGELHEQHVARTTAKTLYLYCEQLTAIRRGSQRVPRGQTSL